MEPEIKLVFDKRLPKEKRDYIQNIFDKKKQWIANKLMQAQHELLLYGDIIDPELKELCDGKS